MQKRDEDLDIIRALGMLWISFVHCIYWTNVFTDPMSMKIVSWLLIEMPVMFFVMGASNRDSDTSVYGKFVLRRLKRVYIPSGICKLYAVVLALLLLFNSRVSAAEKV